LLSVTLYSTALRFTAPLATMAVLALGAAAPAVAAPANVYAPETKSLSEVARLSGCAGVKFRRREDSGPIGTGGHNAPVYHSYRDGTWFGRCVGDPRTASCM